MGKDRLKGTGREDGSRAQTKPGRPWEEVLNAQILCRQLRAFICGQQAAPCSQHLSSRRGTGLPQGKRQQAADLRAMPTGSGEAVALLTARSRSAPLPHSEGTGEDQGLLPLGFEVSEQG